MGGFEVDEAWADSKLTTATIKSLHGQTALVAYPGIEEATVCTTNGMPVSAEVTAPGRLRFNTTEGTTYVITMPNAADAVRGPHAATQPANNAGTLFDLTGRPATPAASGILVQTGRLTVKNKR